MIRVNIARDKEGFIQEFTVKGHAGYDDPGKDIVCAAVSTVAYTALGALEELAGISGYTEKDGYIKFSIPSSLRGEEKYKAGIILETALIGFKQIKMAYGKYVSVVDKEV